MPSRLIVTLLLVACTLRASAADQPQWGQRFSRNMVSEETGLPESFDVRAGTNVKWSVPLGTESYATPVVAGGKVLIGTNNGTPRDPKHQGDRGVLLCLDERDGHLLWQLVCPKLEDDRFLDWPGAGICSAPSVEGDRAYVLTNRAEVACLDMNGLADGNHGPYRDEAKHMTPRGEPTYQPGPLDADIVWLTDLVTDAGIHPHDEVHGSVLVVGDLLYVNTCNGVDNTHRRIRCPDAPSLIVLDKRTGRIVARDDQHIGPLIFHSTWSSPALMDVNGRPQIIFCGGDGVVYGFEAIERGNPRSDGGKEEGAAAASSPSSLRRSVALSLPLTWHFDCDPTAPKVNVHKYVTNHREGPSIVMGMPVAVDGRVYVVSTGDLWWGKRSSVLHCIDGTRSGDITKDGEIWSAPLNKASFATPAVYQDIVFATDCAGTIHCLDRATGRPLWTHQLDGEIWCSPLVADGKVYAGSRKGIFAILAAEREKRIVAEIDLESPIAGTPTAANGVLYVATMNRLYALQIPRGN